MSEEKTIPTQENEVKKPSTEASQNNVDGHIPQHRFNEVNTQKNQFKDQVADLEKQLNQYKADQEAARKAELEKQGEYKTLLDEANAKLEKAQVDVKAWGDYKTTQRNGLLEQLTDEGDKSIAESLPLEKLELYVNKVNKVNSLPTNTSRQADTKPVGDYGGFSSYAEWAEKDPDSYEKANNSLNGIPIGYNPSNE